ncbi:NGFI-A-binding protein homolog [Nilaparvata lugens]|uniref:NGFI-A-binding protein homolog n=1 Tax=Nilaparvata lugens TaxID=108931 RepID=UPI00193CB96C|nr:NGFI-A-binding protein homolog [Nilaparvata lugens]
MEYTPSEVSTASTTTAATSSSSTSSSINHHPVSGTPPLSLPQQATAAAGSTTASAAAAVTSSSGVKILSRNANGTLIYTHRPRDEAELQLYRVMQRASLLAYYDTLLEMGGDDVQQLCEAGEEEFLEIMALVGMASKPLHVRRLQKALQEWLSNPSMFQMPLGATPSISSSRSEALPLPLSPQATSPSPLPTTTISTSAPSPNNLGADSCPRTSPGVGSAARSCSPPGSPMQGTPVLVASQIARLAEAAQRLVRNLPHLEPKISVAKKKSCKDLEMLLGMPEDDPRRMDQIRKFAAIYGRFDCKRKPEKPLTLHEVSVNEAAAQICRLAPALLTRRDELFPLARQVVRDSGYHYSKGHSKSYSSLSMRNSSMNGDNGGPMKRARLDGCSPISVLPSDSTEELALRLKRQERLSQVGDELRRVTEQVEQVYRESSAEFSLHLQVEALQTRQAQLLLEQNELLKQHNSVHHNHHRLYRRPSRTSCFDSEKLDTDDTDSQFSFSNASSPSQEIGDSRDSLRESDSNDLRQEFPRSGHLSDEGENGNNGDKDLLVTKNEPQDNNHYEDSFYQENKVQVIASSGGNIIAVANPALSMSPAIAEPLLKKELSSTDNN